MSNTPETEIKDKSIEQSSGVNMKDMLYFCLSKWYWFLISLVVIVGAGVFYISTTPPTYSVSAEVLIKQDSKTRSMTDKFQFADMGLLNGSSRVYNEVYVFKSPHTIESVVKRLDLTTNYLAPGRRYDRTLYGKSLPIRVAFCDQDSPLGSFSVNVTKDGQVKVSSFKYTSRGGDKVEDKSTVITGKLTDTLVTPMSRIVIYPTRYYIDLVKDNSNVLVRKSDFNKTTESYTNRVNAALGDKQSDVISLDFTDVNKERAEAFLNTLIEVYNDDWVQDKNEIAVTTSQFIRERLALIEQELGNVDSNISDYKSVNLLSDINAVTSIYVTQNEELNKALLDLDNEIFVTEYIQKYLKNPDNKYQVLPGGSGLSNGSLESQLRDYNQNAIDRMGLISYSSESNPLVLQYNETMDQLSDAILVSMDNQIVALKARKESLLRTEKKNTDRLSKNPEQAKYLLTVERKQQVLESLYLYLLQRQEENELSKAFTAYNTRVITPPRGSDIPSSPKKGQILIICFVLGLCLPFGVIYLREMLNSKIRGKKDLEPLGLPFYGEIPAIVSKVRFKFIKKLFRVKVKEQDPIVVKQGKRDYVNEAFRVMRTNIDFVCSKTRPASVVMFTSFNAGSGKSFISDNLGLSFVIKNKKVVVVDCDLRHGSSSKNLGAKSVGLSAFLSGAETDLKKVIYTSEAAASLDYVPVGAIPPNPTELLEEPLFGEMIEMLKGMYDLVILDCPPVDIVADAQIVQRYVDRTAFVVRVGLLDRAMLPELKAIYNEKKYKGMGIVINCVPTGAGTYGHRYAYKYGYGYHYGHKYGYSYGVDAKDDE